MDDARHTDPGHAPGEGRAGARRAVASTLAGGLLVLAACGGGDDCPTCPGPGVERVDLTVGEAAVRAAGSSVLQIQLPAGSEGRVYDVAAQVDSRSLGTTPLRLNVRSDGDGGDASLAPSAAARRFAGDGWSRHPASQAWDLARRVEIQEGARRLLRSRNVRPARPSAGDGPRPRFSSMLPNSAPDSGQMLDFWYPVQSDFSIDCDTAAAEVVTGEVMAVGSTAIMVRDTTVPEAGILGTPMNYDSLATAFDQEVLGTDVAYFGEPSDIDDNGHVYILFTNRVNELTEPDDEGIVTGFFLPTDLADSGDQSKSGSTAVNVCEAGNEAEVLYLLAPDPNGDHGKEVPVEQAKRSAGGTSAHEFQHLLNAANRVIKQSGSFADLEATWLDEGLSHVAEEVVGLALTGDPIRSNLGLAEVVEDSAEVSAFNTFHLPNFGRLAEYLRAPAGSEVLTAGSDPQGLQSLRMRGFAWSLLRWLADHEAAASATTVPTSGEESFFRDLAQADGGLETGVANLETVAAATWSELLADYGLVPAADDAVAAAPDRLMLPTWNLRDVYLRLHQAFEGQSDQPFPEEYPLAVTEVTFGQDTTVDFSVQGGTQKYFRFDGSAASTPIVIELSNQSDAAPGAGARLLVLRAE